MERPPSEALESRRRERNHDRHMSDLQSSASDPSVRRYLIPRRELSDHEPMADTPAAAAQRRRRASSVPTNGSTYTARPGATVGPSLGALAQAELQQVNSVS